MRPRSTAATTQTSAQVPKKTTCERRLIKQAPVVWIHYYSVVLFCLLLSSCNVESFGVAFFPKAASNQSSSRRRQEGQQAMSANHAEADTVSTDTSSEDDDDDDDNKSVPHLIFPGGGIFFYWQAGAVIYLREQGYDLDATTLTGASAGALTATLSATNVDFYEATEKALALAADAGVWDRSGGLQGIWGPLIHDWLDDLLPDDAVDRVNARLALLLTPVPLLGQKEKITHFRDKEDLIRCNMASVHLPWFLDSKLTSNFRNRPYIDGSFLAQAKDYHTTELWKPKSKTLILDYNRDPVYQSQSLLSFVDAVSPDGIYKMLEDGKRYAKQLEERGKLTFLRKKDDAD